MPNSETKLLDVGADLNGRSVSLCAYDEQGEAYNRVLQQLAMVGIPPECPGDNWVWTNRKVRRFGSDRHKHLHPLEELWENLKPGAQPVSFTTVDGQTREISPGEAIGIALEQLCDSVQREGLDARDACVVAIPDRMVEDEQHQLLRGLRLAGRVKTELLWRSVAIALSWIQKSQIDDTDDLL